MNLKPHEILKVLGFNIGEEGITINPNDAFLITSALRLAGSTIDFDRVPESELVSVHTGLAGIVAAWRNEPPSGLKADSLDKLRSTLAVVLQQTFNKQR